MVNSAIFTTSYSADSCGKGQILYIQCIINCLYRKLGYRYTKIQTSCPKGNNPSPESNMHKRSNMVFSAIKAYNSKVNSPLCLNFEHMWDFIPAQVICKFHEDPIKMKGLCPEQCHLGLFQQSWSNNSKVLGLNRSEFELVWDLMPVLITCNFDKDPINKEWPSVET